MKRRSRRDLTIALALALAAVSLLFAAAGAEASSLALKCSGHGPQTKAQEYETAECAVQPGESRKIEGVLRDNDNKLVAAPIKVTFSNWEPQGNGAYDITPYKTIEVKSAANGKFTIPQVTAKTEETVFIEAPEDFEANVSAVNQEVNIQRIVTASAKPLGGGKVKVTVKGTEGSVKVTITDEEGYSVTGGAARKLSKGGTAIFHLGRTYGKLGIYVDAGKLTDLYYLVEKPFKV
jgi:hypothetical protein